MRSIICSEIIVGKNIPFKFKKGLSQGSMIGFMICNIVLDGLQDFIQDNLPVRYRRSKKELKYIKYKLGEKSSSPTSHAFLRVFCVRYVDDILILGKCLKLHVKKIQKLLVIFLSQRGLEIKNALMFQGKCFKPGASFDYLGFTFKYPKSDLISFNKEKYTKTQFNLISVGDGKLLKHSKSGLCLLIKSICVKKLKNFLRVRLCKKNSNFSVKTMVGQVNAILKSFLNYYNLTTATKKQWLSIKNLLHKLFYKYLLRKFSSVPKIYSFIKINFINQNCFKNKIL